MPGRQFENEQKVKSHNQKQTLEQLCVTWKQKFRTNRTKVQTEKKL